MTACVFYDIDPQINKFIDSGDVTFYSKSNNTITINDYIKDCEDKENSEKTISKLQDKLYPVEKVKPIEKPVTEKEVTNTSTLNNYSFDNSKHYSKMTTEEFFRKLSQDRIRRQNIKRQNKIHNWYRYNKEDIDELFFKGMRTFQDHGVEFTYDIREMYDQFVEQLYYNS